MDERYLLDNASTEAERRFAGLDALFNPSTFRHFERLGVTAGWRCWEVGVGGPSVPAWLADRVGPSGHVLATDIDTRWATEVEGGRPNVEVRPHDVAADPVPATDLNLVHERLVLIHVPGREEALAHMVDALQPGGWLLVEDFDSTIQPLACPDPRTPAEERANAIRAGFREMLAGRGADLRLGRRYPAMLRGLGLEDVAAEGALSLASPASNALELANVTQVRDELVRAGHATDDEVDAHLAAVGSGEIAVATALLVSAWGRKPG